MFETYQRKAFDRTVPGLVRRETLILGTLAPTELGLTAPQLRDECRELRTGSFFSHLMRLEEMGYVKSCDDSATDGVYPRRRFMLTEKGRRILFAWRKLNDLLKCTLIVE